MPVLNAPRPPAFIPSIPKPKPTPIPSETKEVFKRNSASLSSSSAAKKATTSFLAVSGKVSSIVLNKFFPAGAIVCSANCSPAKNLPN